MSNQLKCHFRDMQPAAILCAISQLNAEIAERQSELERLKRLYTEKANADIQFALKAVTGQGQPISNQRNKLHQEAVKKYETNCTKDVRPTIWPDRHPDHCPQGTDQPGMSNTGKVHTVLNKVNYRVY